MNACSFALWRSMRSGKLSTSAAEVTRPWARSALSAWTGCVCGSLMAYSSFARNARCRDEFCDQITVRLRKAPDSACTPESSSRPSPDGEFPGARPVASLKSRGHPVGGMDSGPSNTSRGTRFGTFDARAPANAACRGRARARRLASDRAEARCRSSRLPVLSVTVPSLNWRRCLHRPGTSPGFSRCAASETLPWPRPCALPSRRRG